MDGLDGCFGSGPGLCDVYTHKHKYTNTHTHTRTQQQPRQIDRARAIFTHGSNYADPKRDPSYWKKWQDFEVRPCVGWLVG
jgi:hypothetical protein